MQIIISLKHLIGFKFLVEAIMLGDKVCTPLQLPGTCQVSGHFGAKSVLPVSDQLVGGLHHFITGLLEVFPVRAMYSKTWQFMIWI